LYNARRWDDAESAFNALAEESPEVADFRSYLGVLAARRGDREEAQRVALWLENIDRPYLSGEHTLGRARIAAVLGERDHAVALLRQAFAQGLSWFQMEGFQFDFDALRDQPEYQELVRPKG
jgi:hypothetical protein